MRSHGGHLLASARRILRDEEDARDCVQEAFLAAHRSISRFEGHSGLGTWLHRIVTNAALMKLRARRSRPEELIDDFLPQFDRYARLVGPTQITQATAEELLEREGVRKQVWDAIDRLPQRYRTVLVLRDIEGYSTKEAADLLQITPGAAKLRLHRARTALKNILASVLECDV